ncbi:hypothetical protein BC941DRAFT_447348 [Chlamydoabsidia padenii]|nr:hypothetical protein BC941DRAFT_447348 [Chlamydoabsidia padenii]
MLIFIHVIYHYGRSIELFSTDLIPDSIGLVEGDYSAVACTCRVRDTACYRCGNIVGYHVNVPLSGDNSKYRDVPLMWGFVHAAGEFEGRFFKTGDKVAAHESCRLSVKLTSNITLFVRDPMAHNVSARFKEGFVPDNYLSLCRHAVRLTSSSPHLEKEYAHATYDDDTLKRSYPVESTLVELFPNEVYDLMNNIERNDKQRNTTLSSTRYGNTLLTFVLNQLYRWIPRRRPLLFSWSNYYHQLQNTTTNDATKGGHPSYQCEDQPLPYPILYHLVKQILKSNDTMNQGSYGTLPNLDRPFILLPFDPSVADQVTLSSGKPVCVRAIIPPSVLTKNNNNQPPTPYHYRYQPYSTQDNGLDEPVWWDMMQVSARHLVTNASITFDMRPWDGHRVLREGYQKKWFEHENSVPNWSRRMIQDMDERGWLHIYQVNAVFFDPGDYVLDAKLEFQDAYWNTDLGPVQPYHPVSLPIEPGAQVAVSTTTRRTDVDQLVLDHLDLPLCKAGKGDYPGRWLPWPFGDKVDASRMVTGLDKHGKFWAPFECRYRPLSHNQFHRCLAKRFPGGLNVYGDSNMRRSIKSFLSHGQWCKGYEQYRGNNNNNNNSVVTGMFDSPRIWKYLGDPNQIRACQCEDFREPTWNPAWFNATARRWDTVFGNTEEETRNMGHDTEWDHDNDNQQGEKDGIPVSSYKWDGLTFMNDQGWEATFTNSTDQLPSDADLVVVSLVNWDIAYMQFDEFQQALQSLVNYLKTQQGRLIYRTPQYYCCRVDQTNRHRKSNTARMKLFDQAARQLFQSEFDDLMVWDVTILGEARTWDEKREGSTCGANHAQADVIHLENQILMNALCN